MGGHGGLNILPQKRWNVYNFDNREKVRKDEEEAARDEQLKREQSRRRDAEVRLHRLRRARGISPDSGPKPADANHINLFGALAGEAKDGGEKDGGSNDRKKRAKKQESVRAVGPDDEKYRLGYGIAGKGVKAPWYVSRPVVILKNENEGKLSFDCQGAKKKEGRKTVEELRAERLSREKKENKRERELVRDSMRKEREEEISNIFGKRKFTQ